MRKNGKTYKVQDGWMMTTMTGKADGKEDETDCTGRVRSNTAKLRYQWNKLRSRYSWTPRLEFPDWGWAKNFEWLSRTHYENRSVILRQKHKRQIIDRLELDVEKTQIKFIPNRYKSAKYALWTFPIVNFFEQCRRGANFYFMVSLVLTLMIDSPISPYTWLMTLMIVFLVSMIKQGYEDYLRHKEDAKRNKRQFSILRKGKAVLVESKKIEVGDILILKEGETVPCDVVLLSSSHSQGQCFIETSNLDGETSLKTRYSLPLTKDAKSLRQVSTLFGCIECENPNPKLDTFLGRLTTWTCQDNDEPKVCPISNDNVLLADCVLKNTSEVYTVCVYSGVQTKISLNSKITKNKFSTIEKSLNKYLIFLIVILLSEMISSTILSFSFDYEFKKSSDLYLSSLAQVFRFFGADKETYLNITNINHPEHRENIGSLFGFEGVKNYPHTHSTIDGDTEVWYLDKIHEVTFVRILEFLLLWMVLYNYIIPLSTYVSLEFVKVMCSVQFTWDAEMYDEEFDEPAQCHTSDINEELGLVTHILTDKTGTITKNEMILKMMLIGDHTYLVDESFPQAWDRCMMILCLCHSVQVANGEFIASSPDEMAILESCKTNRFIFNGELPNQKLIVTARGVKHTYDKLAELPFDSFRKCMTVIVKDEAGTIHVLSKGAEVAMLENCTSGDKLKTEQEIDCFANDGLRALALGCKTITEDQFQTFQEALELAQQSIVNRAKYVREVYQDLESGLEMVGATGIEDRLQDQVPETIYDLKRAGIQIWMLTGDKKETAINAGHSAGILKLDSELIDLCDTSDSRDISVILEEVKDQEFTTREIETSMIVDGKSVANIFKNPDSVKILQKLSLKCNTVIACRLSPIQKSQLVRLVKEADPHNVTAAIGDGGNDISMLQEAHVGIGIIGREGRAAAQASDFAFSKFKFLRRALLVHGNWFYTREAFLVQYSFYKNIACFTGQFFFMFWSNYSAQTLFESTFLLCFNTFYTSFPVIVYSITEQNHPAKTLLNNPALYKENRRNAAMSNLEIFRWILVGVWHNAVVFFIWLFCYQNFGIFCDRDLFFVQCSVAQTIIIIVNIKILLDSNHWTWPLVITVALSIGSYFGLTTIYNYIGPMSNFLLDNSDIFMSYHAVLADGEAWLCTLLITVTALIPNLVGRTFWQHKYRRHNKRNQTLPAIEDHSKDP